MQDHFWNGFRKLKLTCRNELRNLSVYRAQTTIADYVVPFIAVIQLDYHLAQQLSDKNFFPFRLYNKITKASFAIPLLLPTFRPHLKKT